MNLTEHLLACLAKEASEVVKDAMKALRFGPTDTNFEKPDGPNNSERIAAELNDLIAVADLLVEYGVLDPNWNNRDAQIAKQHKVERMWKYARQVGALSSEL